LNIPQYSADLREEGTWGTLPMGVGIDPTTNGWFRLGRLTRASFPRGQQEEAGRFVRLIFGEYNEKSALARGRVISLKISSKSP
jgi:hypothetical protein